MAGVVGETRAEIPFRRNDTQKASEYGLTGGVVLHLVLALRGGRAAAE